MEGYEHIGETIAGLKERNARVEADKAWETSLVRISSIALITYVCAALLMLMIGVPSPFLSALVPVLGYTLSTQSLPFIRSWWVRRYSRRREY